MREQIAEWLNYYRYGRIILWKDLDESAKEFVRTGADQILSLLIEEIRKVENLQFGERWDGFELCRQKILKKLEEK